MHTNSATSYRHKATLNWTNKHYGTGSQLQHQFLIIITKKKKLRSLSAHKLIPLQNAHVFSKDKLSMRVGMIHTDVMVSKVLQAVS